MIEAPELKSLDGAAKDALILALIERINALIAENTELRERVARLGERLGQPASVLPIASAMTLPRRTH